jgi:1-acyl-sn-glycerol-3-phosphate acyltransferase
MRYLGYGLRWVIGFSFFFLLAALVLIGVWFVPPRQLYSLAQPLCRLALKAVGLRIKVVGRERFTPHEGPYLIIANHESLLDAFICPAYIPIFFTTVELAEHFSWPLWGAIIKRWGHIPIGRGFLQDVKKSLDQAKHRLQSGTSILIFPEGGRTITGQMQPFKKGAFYLAYEARANILPMAIHGLYYAKTRGDWRFRSANVGLIFGRPLKFSDYQNWSIEQLRDWAWKTVAELKQEVRVHNE